MQYVETGKGQLPLVTLVAILSISLVVNLPGLAISPLMDDLDRIFPTVSKLEIQLLTILPNLFIIPFVLLSGKLSVSKNKIRILIVGLCIYMLSAILYFFAQSMNALILISCLLGIGCGAVIPLAAGLIADYFTGDYRMKQLGIKSGIANFTLIFATLLVGWLGNRGWHLPFLVYLVPVIPLLLSPFLTARFINRYGRIDRDRVGRDMQTAQPQPTDAIKNNRTIKNNDSIPIEFHFKGKESVRLMIGVTALYFMITYSCMAVSYYLPFTMQQYGMDSTEVGVVTSLFFLSITLPGFFLPVVIRIFRHFTVFVAILFMAIGLFLMGYGESFGYYMVAVIFEGMGYGIIQPVIYDKTTYIVPDARKATQYLAIVLSANYVGITVAPFFVDLMKLLLNIQANSFPYYLNGVIMGGVAIVSLVFFQSFVFKVQRPVAASSKKS